MDSYSPIDDTQCPKLSEWKEYVQFIMAIQFYLGNSAGLTDPLLDKASTYTEQKNDLEGENNEG